MIPFTMASKRIKCFDVNLSMEMKDLYTKTTKYSWKNLKKTLLSEKTSRNHEREDNAVEIFG